MNPYLVLDLPPDAGDGDVRSAYQRLLRKYPPEHQPDQFQKIQEAYSLLRTSRDRWRWKLLHLKDRRTGPVEALEEFVQLPARMRPPGAKPLLALLKSCVAAAARDATKPPRKR